jgi:hypothetical protein
MSDLVGGQYAVACQCQLYLKARELRKLYSMRRERTGPAACQSASEQATWTQGY